MGNSSHVSCPTNPPLSMTERTEFGTRGCIVYGYPSTGGVLIKEADLLDMLFLSLPRAHTSQRSPSADEEDRFCKLMRRTGATLWPSKEDEIDVQLGVRKATEEEAKVLVLGWPADGVGGCVDVEVWECQAGAKGFWEIDFSDEYGGEDTDNERIRR